MPAIKVQKKPWIMNFDHLTEIEKINPMKRERNPSLEKVSKSAVIMSKKEEMSVNRFFNAKGPL
ncbi:MAG: hypothetical protein HBSIN01_03140 [Candidatus Brocadia sinica]|nr:MAG: hypothetical protein BroJett002_33750 [Candidatus Brocadia sinica]GJQ16355.1 MAG: hypothetical protein HBSIN01_03140 [Candidatus Brocadia sinica]